MGDFSLCRSHVERLLQPAGIQVNGPEPWDIKVHDRRFYRRILTDGHLGAGESYMEGWWDCRALDEFIYRVLRAGVDKKVSGFRGFLEHSLGRLMNRQAPRRAWTVGRTHYDTGNDLFQAMLDSRMMYSCGYWKDADTLEQAQEQKLRLVFNKLDLKPGMQVLDIGCGFGGAAKFAAEEYGVEVTAVTISGEQHRLARERCRTRDVQIELMDYRDIRKTFDRIYSIGMFEHVGYRNYRTYFDTLNRCLKKDGVTLLHTIGSNRPSTSGDPWSEKYIFPNSMLPAASQITRAYEGRFMLEDWHVFSLDYARTLMAWHHNFETAWPQLRHHYSDTFRRMWNYYLLSFAGAFRARNIQLWQVLLSKKGMNSRKGVPR
ncbi:cyclopropane fatty acyl phospholipid synthase [Pelodictyon luteolum]|uniref:Cyclopropane-fatty-acyl-phospholipid synthase n=1 Tax=Chlorobium luteolum (strain DSM 273 / BCRC 81028 / 2530) TaxID=319225 RepID=Q3B3N5_CHLL3|nr:cyclopropane fatty acyl phospholipid synthase [Pelodictyon luteolum]ABB24046.1 cyclopropane-fatty-acyl-phospholipid synthase [Pelodictyon luteolum DSM 273]